MSALEKLTACAGTWSGTNTLQDPNTNKPDKSDSTVTVTPVLAGRFVRIDYTWGYQGKPQEGSLLVGFDPKTGKVSGHWIDTWHMGRIALNCVGSSPTEGHIAVRGSYAAPPGPDWGWRIEIATGEDALRITHTNIDADGTEDLAAEGVYSRA
jgi:hypothetical protein